MSKFTTFVSIVSWLLILGCNFLYFILFLVRKPSFKIIWNCYVRKVNGSCFFFCTFAFSENSFGHVISKSWKWVTVNNVSSIVESGCFSFRLSKLNAGPKYSWVSMLTNFSSTVSNNLIIFLIKSQVNIIIKFVWNSTNGIIWTFTLEISNIVLRLTSSFFHFRFWLILQSQRILNTAYLTLLIHFDLKVSCIVLHHVFHVWTCGFSKFTLTDWLFWLFL